ncbi:MAG TPA: hypothetical protein VFB72_18040 [Verrucomicrobiae bacterium]|nr:hypothetical protein [Verrucomicrobiae bacterium]
MFNAQDIRDRIQAHPFKPFRIVLSDGRHFDVPNHDAAFLKRNAVQVALDLDNQGLASRFIDCAIIHITSIEEPQAA